MSSLVDLNFVGIVDSLMKGADNLFTSDDQRNDFKLKFQELLMQPQVMQALANQEAAKHDSLFVAGARPAILWVCALGLAWTFLIQPVLVWLLVAVGLSFMPPDQVNEMSAALPQLDTESIWGLTGAVLGMAGWRSWDKKNGVARGSL